MKKLKIPPSFIFRRIQSLMGLWLIIFLFEHLLINSQAALWLGDQGSGFVRMVNLLQSIPYLHVIEVVIISLPILFHVIWGLKYMISSENNAKKTDGKTSSLMYKRNRAYVWQRITSYIIAIFLIFHVADMRFIRYPVKTIYNNEEQYLVKLNFDEGLYGLTARMQGQLFDKKEIVKLSEYNDLNIQKVSFDNSFSYEYKKASEITKAMAINQIHDFISSLNKFSLKDNQIIAAMPSPGKAILLTVRDTFKSYYMIFFYSIFVIAAIFHAINGLWTFMISWGLILSYRSQKSMLNVCLLIMLILAFLGLSAIWGTYLVTLR